MKKFLKGVGLVTLVLLLAMAGVFFWASTTVRSSLARTIPVHAVPLAVPFPLNAQELAELEPGADADAVALERAIERGQHLVQARYACVECHGQDFSGGVMVDDPAMGQLLGPNLTSGAGGVVGNYSSEDWDAIVRHGVRADGHPALMPSEDFVRMSDRELSDIVAFIQSRPPVDNVVPDCSLGPVGTMLAALGKLPLSADTIASHQEAHMVEPPPSEPTAEFGAHLIRVCTGCHRPSLEGGPIAAGPPDWLPAANLTPHADGIPGWSFEDFERAMRQGVRPDGSALRPPMELMQPYAQRMTDVEMRALWAYVESVEARPMGR